MAAPLPVEDRSAARGEPDADGDQRVPADVGSSADGGTEAASVTGEDLDV